MAKQKQNGEPKAKKAKPVTKPEPTNVTPIEEVETINAQDNQEVSVSTLTFTLGSTNKAGQGRYHFPGYAATLFFSKSVFDGEPPTEIQVVADGINFAVPGSKTTKSKKVLTPEEQAKKDARAAKKAEREANIEETTKKLQARLEKLQEKLAKAQAKIPAPAVEM